jgi:hypothetical protein
MPPRILPPRPSDEYAPPLPPADEPAWPPPPPTSPGVTAAIAGRGKGDKLGLGHGLGRSVTRGQARVPLLRYAVNGSLTEGATSCLIVGPRCHKPCQSAFSGRSVLFETNWPKCGSSVRLERKLVIFRNFASKVLVLCYILIDLLCPLKLCSNYSLAVLVIYVLEKLKYFLIPLSLVYNTFYVISMCVEGIILCSRIMEELVVYDWCDNLPRSTG